MKCPRCWYDRSKEVSEEVENIILLEDHARSYYRKLVFISFWVGIIVSNLIGIIIGR